MVYSLKNYLNKQIVKMALMSSKKNMGKTWFKKCQSDNHAGKIGIQLTCKKSILQTNYVQGYLMNWWGHHFCFLCSIKKLLPLTGKESQPLE